MAALKFSKVIVSFLLVAIFAGAAFASAAQLNLNSQGVQAGNIDIRGCQGDLPVSLNFDIQWGLDPATGLPRGFVVHGVVIGGINERCIGHKMQVVLTFADGTSQDLGKLTVGSSMVSPGMVEILLSPEPPASDLTDAHVLIQ
jgi:hypothetical protein